MTATTLTLSPTGLTSADLSQGRLFLQQTRDGLIGSARMVTPAQWTFKPGPERWSVAEIVEHVIAVQELVIGMIRQQLSSAPPPPAEQDREVVDSIVIHQIPSRLSKFPSPLPSTPGLREHALDSPPLNAVSKRNVFGDGRLSVDSRRGGARRTSHQANSRTDRG
jgi:hypothetical protein